MRRTILLVEDDPNDAALTLRAFQRNNIPNAINVVGDGMDALDFLFARGVHADRAEIALPSLVILDLKLPRLDGLGVLREIRADERTANVPVVILTTSSEDDDIAAGYSLGANSYVRKPVDFEEFMEAVKTLGVYWMSVNQGPPA